MLSIYTAIALAVLPMGSSVTHLDQGFCVESDNVQLKVCNYQGDNLTIYVNGESMGDTKNQKLMDLISNI